MCRGWAKGGESFKKGLLKEFGPESVGEVSEVEARELKEHRWESQLRRGLEALGKTPEDLLSSRKGEPWKVSLARHMRERCLAPTAWLAQRMNMGGAKSVARRISEHRRETGCAGWEWERLKMLECVG